LNNSQSRELYYINQAILNYNKFKRIHGYHDVQVSQDLSLSEIPSLVGITLQQIATGLDSERFTTEMLVTAYLARITEVNDEFRAIIELNGNALNEARELDKLRRVSGRLR
jgi:hypothetical protein